MKKAIGRIPPPPPQLLCVPAGNLEEIVRSLSGGASSVRLVSSFGSAADMELLQLPFISWRYISEQGISKACGHAG